MNEIVNSILVAGDKFINEIHLGQLDLHIELMERINKKKKKQEIHDIFIWGTIIAYGDFKDLTRRAATDKLLHDKAFTIAKNLKYDGYHSWIASLVHKFFD